MNYKYVTIEREYGSRGTKIGEELAKKCSIPCYGKEILEMVSDKYNISVDQIEKYEEKATNSFLYSIALLGKLQSGDTNILSKEAEVYMAEQEIVKQMAMEGAAVFVGRCAAAALKEQQEEVLRVFIHADNTYRRKNAVTQYEIPEDSAESVIRRYDRKRAAYYGTNTGKGWRDWNNYDIILDSSALGVSGCVNALYGIVAD